MNEILPSLTSSRLRFLCFARLAAFWSIEDDPKDQIAGEVLKPVDRGGCVVECVRWAKRLQRNATNELTGRRGYEVDHVTSLGLLRIRSTRCVDLNQEASVLKDRGEALTFRPRETFKSSDNGRADARIIRLHLCLFRLLCG